MPTARRPRRAPPKQRHLLELPTELRLEIYQWLYRPGTFNFCVTGSRTWVKRTSWTKRQRTNVSLLATCRSIHAEATPVFYNAVSFGCVITKTIHAWAPTWGLPDFGAFKGMRTLGVCIGVTCYGDVARTSIDTLVGFLAMIEFSAPSLEALILLIHADRLVDNEHQGYFEELMSSLSRTRFQGHIRSRLVLANVQNGGHSLNTRTYHDMLAKTGRHVT